MKNLTYLLISLVLLTSCLENSPGFLEPQPADSKNLNSFPKKLHGKYRIDDEENLTITKYSIMQWGSSPISMSMTEIDTNDMLVLKNDSLFDLESNERILVVTRNDSVFGTISWNDTAFYFSENFILRKLKTNYLLNEYTKDSIWKVVRLRCQKPNNIEFATISKKKELDELKKYTSLYNIELKNDTIVDYALKPTRKEFALMLSSDELFTDKEIYEKIKP